MTRQSTSARAALLEKPGPAVIARFVAGAEDVDFPVTEADLDRDSAFWSTVLAAYGIRRGSRVVVSATGYEMVWTEPARMAVAALGGSYSNVEAWGWDARRLDMFCRRLNPAMVLGIGREITEGLGNLAELGERLGPVPALVVRPDALEPLEDAGITPAGLLTAIGPATAVTLAGEGLRAGLAYDAGEWSIESVDGELLVTTVGDRAATFDRRRSGVRGTVQQTANGPRIMLEEWS